MKLTLVLILSLSALLGLLLIDDELDTGPAAWVSLAMDDEVSESEAFHYLFGLMAHASAQPAVVGKDLLRAYLEQEAKFTGRFQSFQFKGYPADKRLTLPEGEVYCHLREHNCFDTLLGNRDLISDELDRHTVLLDRYREFLSYDDFRTLTKPSVYAPMLEYQYLEKGNRLNGFLILRKISEGQGQAAIDILYADISRQRRLLKKADTLITKMVAVSLLANDLDLLANLHAAGYIKNPPELARLTLDERSLYLPMMREFAIIVSLHSDLHRNPEFFEEGDSAPAWLMQVIFKPNMSINKAFPLYAAVHKLSLDAPADYAAGRASLEAFADAEAEGMLSIRNLAGDILTRVAMPDFTQYVSRMHDLDCKIKLLSIVLAPGNDERLFDGFTGADHTGISNPYDADEAPYLNHETGKLCYSGPANDRNEVRCIRI